MLEYGNIMLGDAVLERQPDAVRYPRRRRAPQPLHAAYDDYIFDDYTGPDKGDPLDPPAHVTLQFCLHSFVERGQAYLVRGVGKRAIHVAIAMPWISSIDSTINERQLAYKAACKAHRLGWRRVVVALDDYFGDDARLFNVHQHKVENLRIGHQGKFLHQVRRERSF